MVLYIFYKNKRNRYCGFFFQGNNGIIKVMKTIITKVDKNQIEKEVIEQANYTRRRFSCLPNGNGIWTWGKCTRRGGGKENV